MPHRAMDARLVLWGTLRAAALCSVLYVPLEHFSHSTQPRSMRAPTVQADISVEVQEGGDIGFRWNAQSGVYELVTDLDLWKQQIPVERFLTRLTQRYALNTVLSASLQEGFQVEKQINLQDGGIELVVTRWDA